MSRTDDVINVAGHRITTGSIEEVIIAIPEIVECAVVSSLTICTVVSRARCDLTLPIEKRRLALPICSKDMSRLRY